MDIEGTPAEVRALFDEVAYRRARGTTGGSQSEIRVWLAETYAQYMQASMIAAGSIMIVVGIVRRKSPGLAMWAFTAAVFVLAGLVRLAGFTLLEASSFGVSFSNETRYLVPAALTLTIATVWLLGEGIRLLVSPEVRAAASAKEQG